MYFGNILFGQIHFGKIHFGTIHFGNIQFAVCTMHFIQYILWQDTLWKEESGWQNIRDIWDGKRKQGGWRLSNGEMRNERKRFEIYAVLFCRDFRAIVWRKIVP